MDWNLRIHINNTMNTELVTGFLISEKGIGTKNLRNYNEKREDGRGITVNVYRCKRNYGDKEGRHYLIGSTKLTGNTTLRKVEIPVTQNLDQLKGMKSIYIEFSSPTSFESTSLTARGQAICDINKIQFELN